MLSKNDIFFILESYILEVIPELLPRNVLVEMSFEEIGANNLIKKKIIEGILEIFSLDISATNTKEINVLQEIVDFLYTNKVQ